MKEKIVKFNTGSIKSANAKHRSVLFVVLPYLERKKDATKAKTRSFMAFPYGVLSIATYLRNKAAVMPSMKIVDLNSYTSDRYAEVLEQAIESLQPDIVGISMMFDQSYKHVAAIARQAKRARPSVKVIIGGAAATTAYEEIITDQPDIDALCYSEGEAAMLSLINSENLDDAFMSDPWVTRTALASGAKPVTVYVPHLNDVINVNYDLIDMSAYSMKEAFSPFASYRNRFDVRQFFLVTSRGCPFKCVFCAEPYLHGGTVRYADVDAIIAHVRLLVDKYGMNVLTFYDDQLLMAMPRAKELFRRLAEFKLRLEAPNGVTVVFIDDEMAYLMKQAGFDTLPLAIESGSNYVLHKIIKKPIRLDRVGPVVKTLQKNDIFVQAYFVIGLPGEREEDRIETVKCIKEWGVDWSGFSMATPLRGSELYKIAMEKGYIPPNMKLGEIEGNKYILNAPEIGLVPENISRQAYVMNLDVNFVNNRHMRIGEYQVAANCFAEVVERYGNHAFGHYFLAQAYKALHADPALIAENMQKYQELIGSDPEWRSYASEFGMPT